MRKIQLFVFKCGWMAWYACSNNDPGVFVHKIYIVIYIVSYIVRMYLVF